MSPFRRRVALLMAMSHQRVTVRPSVAYNLNPRVANLRRRALAERRPA